ncbi:MAG: GrpB family protein [Candidatus Buchananbacteria bacterium]
MITIEQQQWLDHLNDTDKVLVVPWDPTCENKFLKIKKQIQTLLGDQQAVKHRGASSLKISGQDEIDIYIPVLQERYNKVVDCISGLYGAPRSNYALKRARFVTEVEGKHIDVFVINEDDKGWEDSEIFYNFLLAHPETLENYQKLKEEAAGKSTRAYYTVKTEFINGIVSKARV